MNRKSRTFDVPSSTDPKAISSLGQDGARSQGLRVKLTAKERKRVEVMIRNAKSLQEIARLERELSEGRVPGGVRGGKGGKVNEEDEDDDEKEDEVMEG